MEPDNEIPFCPPPHCKARAIRLGTAVRSVRFTVMDCMLLAVGMVHASVERETEAVSSVEEVLNSFKATTQPAQATPSRIARPVGSEAEHSI